MYLTAKELAERWKCSVKKIYAMRDKGQLPYTDLGGTIRFLREDIEKYEKQNTVRLEELQTH